MNAQELLDQLTQIRKLTSQPLSEMIVGVVVKKDVVACGTPTSAVKYLRHGIDWDRSKLMILTEDVLVCQKAKSAKGDVK